MPTESAEWPRDQPSFLGGHQSSHHPARLSTRCGQGQSSPHNSTHGPLPVDLIGGAGQHRLSTTIPPHLGLVEEPTSTTDHWHLNGIGASCNPASSTAAAAERSRTGRFEPQLERWVGMTLTITAGLVRPLRVKRIDSRQSTAVDELKNLFYGVQPLPC